MQVALTRGFTELRLMAKAGVLMLMWIVFELVASVLLFCALALGIYCAMTDRVGYAAINIVLMLVNAGVIIVSRAVQAGVF